MSHVVDILSVVPGTIRVTAEELEVGDTVFDANGGEYQLTRVRRLKRSVRTERNDGWLDWWEPTHTITIRRNTETKEV